MARIENDSFLRACWRKDTDFTPIWFMRQAGRYLESYRKVRADNSVMTICKTPELSTRVTVAAVNELGVDAGILFADIMLPLDAVGVQLDLVDGVGPVVKHPITGMNDVTKLKDFSPKDDVPYVLDSIGLIKQTLDDHVPLIGFSGAPFTLASYLIEGSPSRDFVKTKKLMYNQPDVWKELMRKLSKIVTSYLMAQIHAGVDAVQLFDSWSGNLSPSDYQEFVLPYSKQILEDIRRGGVPRIHFGVGTAGILHSFRDAGGDVVGVDWRVPIDEAWNALGSGAIQGNLDPAALLGQREFVEGRAREILSRIGGRPGHVFNLGHGVHPDTPIELAKALVSFVHKTTQKQILDAIA